MTDVQLASTETPSQLGAALANGTPGVTLAPYRGVLTPVKLDALPTETEALVAGAAVHDLGWRRRVALRGEDRFRWLSGMVTNGVKELPENGGAWNLVLNAQGRIQGDLTVWRDNEALELEIAACQFDKLVAHLDGFIIMDDVEMSALDRQAAAALGLTGPKSETILAAMGLPAPEAMTQSKAHWNGVPLIIRGEYGTVARHFALWAEARHLPALWSALVNAGAQPVGTEALEAVRIAEGIPAYGTDIAERDLPQETSQTRALHFNKGCYLGQEIVERIRSRGNVHRHLRSLELTGRVPKAGTELLWEGAPVGQVTSAAALPLAGGERVFALAILRAEAEVRNQPLQYTTEATHGSARILAAPPTF